MHNDELDLTIKKSRIDLDNGDLSNTQLLPEERDLFKRWYAKHGRDFDNYRFAIRIGKPIKGIEELPIGLQRMVKANWSMRIDFIANKGLQPWIFEIKPIADSNAFGQLIAYRRYFELDHPGEGKPRLAVISNQLENNYEFLYRDENIEVFVM